MKSLIQRILPYITLLMLCPLFINTAFGQEVSVGADIVSRYVFRGEDLGANSPSIQPDIEFNMDGFKAGFWGAYSFSNSNALDEIDIYAAYSVDIAETGSISLGITDYINPNNGIKLGNLNNYDDLEGPGAHWVELIAEYTGPESLPISLLFGMYLYNAENNPIYFQVGYTTSIKDIELNAFIGCTNGDDALYDEDGDGNVDYTGYYGVEKFSIINVGFTASKSIKITDSFSIPLFGSVILNPATENMYYVLGVSF